MTNELLTAALAEKVMHWGVSPDRFLLGGRRWLPRWRFQPTENLEGGFMLLVTAATQEYGMGKDDKSFWARVRIGKSVGEARHESKARAITFAVARAIGLEPEACPPPKTGVECE